MLNLTRNTFYLWVEVRYHGAFMLEFAYFRSFPSISIMKMHLLLSASRVHRRWPTSLLQSSQFTFLAVIVAVLFTTEKENIFNHIRNKYLIYSLHLFAFSSPIRNFYFVLILATRGQMVNEDCISSMYMLKLILRTCLFWLHSFSLYGSAEVFKNKSKPTIN